MPRTKQFNEQEVLEKAMDLFWQKGFHATSISDLVETLGINRASIYNTFGDKKGLFDRSLAYYMEHNHLRLKKMIESGVSPVKLLEDLLTGAIQEALTDDDKKGCFVVNATTELGAKDESISSLLKKNQRKILDLFKTILLKGQEQEEISKGKDLEAMAMSLFIVYSGLRVAGKAFLSEDLLKKSITPLLSMLK